MRAFLITTNELPERTPLGDVRLSAMTTLFDRPFLQHVVEYLANQGFNQFDVVLCQHPEQIKNLLTNGKRWGVRVRHHLVKDPCNYPEKLKYLKFNNQNEWFLLAYADCICRIDQPLIEPNSPSHPPILYCTRDAETQGEDAKPQWTGWAWLSTQHCLAVPSHCDENQLFEFLLSVRKAEPRLVNAPDLICARTYADIMAAHKAVLTKQFTGLMVEGREVEPGVWLSRNISLHPTARINRPVYIGRNCNIGKGVKLGPHTVVGENCVIDDKTILKDTMIFPNIYVGTALELNNSLVDQLRLANLQYNIAVDIKEDILISLLPDSHFPRWLKALPTRLTAALLLLLTFPLFMATALLIRVFKGTPVFDLKPVVRLPVDHRGEWRVFSMICFHWVQAADDGVNPTDQPFYAGWREPLFQFLPGLIHIVRGQLGFVGVAPRTEEEIQALPRDWRSLYLKSKCGLISEALVYFGSNPSEDELRAAETFYAVSASWKYDLKLFIKYIGKLFHLWPKPFKRK